VLDIEHNAQPQFRFRFANPTLTCCKTHN